MFWGIIIGLGVGYFFKPQLDSAVHKLIRAIKDNRNRNNSDRGDTY